MSLSLRLSDTLTLYKDYRAESTSKRLRLLRYRAIIGVGANIGDVKRRFAHLKVFFRRDRRVNISKISSILKNPPFGFLNQDDFYN